jgi:periplasmic protein TonB
MKTTNQPGDFNDLVFENRNKDYGAYTLRRDYSKHVLTAFFFTCAAFVLFAGGMKFFSAGIPLILEKTDEVDSMIIVDFIKDPPIKIDPPKTNTKSSAPKMENNNYQANDTTENRNLTNVELNNLVIGNTNKDTGTTGIVIVKIPKDSLPGDPDPEPERFPPVPPVFNGDLLVWIKEHTNYPTLAKEEGIQGSVFVTFIVEKDGSIGGVAPLNNAPKILEKEALRVISSMPKWTPGMKNGKPVRCYYQVPIRFKLNK